MKKTHDLSYLAGVFDGEGCISISHGAKSWNLSCYVTMAGEYIPRLFQFHFGGSIRHRKPNPAKTQWHDYYKWHIAANKAATFLEELLPYLRLKRPQAELAIKFQHRICSNTHHGRRQLLDSEVALREAEIILMHSLKAESYEQNGKEDNAKVKPDYF